MTIARPESGPGFYGDEAGDLRWWDGQRWSEHAESEGAVPASIREERLDRQIESFTKAGYRLETRSGSQAIVVKPRERRPMRDMLLAIGTVGLSRVLASGQAYHRVIITVDRGGAVRFV